MRWTGLIGILLILGGCYLFSFNRKAIQARVVFWGLVLQFFCAIMVLKGDDVSLLLKKLYPVPYYWNLAITLFFLAGFFFIGKFSLQKPIETIKKGYRTFLWIWIFFLLLRHNVVSRFFSQSRVLAEKFLSYSVQGGSFVFGVLGENVPPPKGVGMVFAFYVLPTIIFVASVFSVLYYYGIMQKVVKFFAWIMAKFMGTSGAESTSVAASIFMGQTEAPLTIRPFLSSLTNSELATVMTSGFAHVSAGIMVAYAAVVGRMDIIVHLLNSVIMTAPGAILVSKMLNPETEKPLTAGSQVQVEVPREEVNVIDAVARGASDGGKLALNVAGMLIAFIALIAVLNGILGYGHQLFETLAEHPFFPQLAGIFSFLGRNFPSTLQQILGWIFAPVAWTMGVAWKDAQLVGSLMGTKVVVNEFVAFTILAQVKNMLSPRSFILVVYALCGFGNFSSIAIQVGGIGGIAPERRHDLARLGLRTMIAGTLANIMAASIVSLLI
jgi:CNT family concentrative nucleoside transporter